MQDLEVTRFRGGPLDGAVVKAPPGAGLPDRDLTITPGGRLYDKARGAYVAGALVVTPPSPRE